MSLHGKTKKYATYGKKSKSRVVEIDSASGRSSYFSGESYENRSLTSQSQPVGGAASSRHLQPTATITQPSSQTQRRQPSPFSSDLLIKYALSKPPQPSPRSPLRKSPAKTKKQRPVKQSDSEYESISPSSSEDEAPQRPSRSSKHDTKPPKRSGNAAHAASSTVPNKERAKTDDAQGSKRDSARKHTGALPLSPARYTPNVTPFEIVPPTPSIVKSYSQPKASKGSRKKDQDVHTAPKPKRKPSQALPAPPKKSAVPALVVQETDDETEAEAEMSRPETLSQKPANACKPTNRRSQEKDTQQTSNTNLDAQFDAPGGEAEIHESANPFQASEHEPSRLNAGLFESPVRPQQSRDRRVAGPVPSPLKQLFTTPTGSSSEGTSMPPIMNDRAVPSEIVPLLRACGQTQAYNFESFARYTAKSSSPGRSTSNMSWRKLGEATYSEIFVRIRPETPRAQQLHDEDAMVVKVVPVYLPNKSRSKSSKKGLKKRNQDDLPEETKVPDALRELTVTRLMNEDDPGGSFISLLGGHIVQGTYPEHFLDEWWSYKKAEPSKALNLCPDAFGDDQYYLVLCLPYGGLDLEAFKIKSWKDAASVLWQTAYGLATAERGWRFEHRDLHWGNVLVRPCAIEAQDHSWSQSSILRSPMKCTASPQQSWPACLEPEVAGIKICIIDYSLSSCDDGEGRRLHGGFDEEAIFEGDGDYQFDIYRMMKEATRGDWADFHPITNLMWLHYLVGRMLNHKGLKPPSAQTSNHKSKLPGFGSMNRQGRLRGAVKRESNGSEEAGMIERQAYAALVLAEQALGQAIHSGGKPDTRGDASFTEALGLGELKDSESFMTWLSVAPQLEGL